MKRSYFRHQRLLAVGITLAANIGTAEIPTQAFFGDLHLHTSMSFDAFVIGADTLPDDAYRFARGEPVKYRGETVQRKAPLDFLAVTDHAEYLGVLRLAADPNGPFKDTRWPKLLSKRARSKEEAVRISPVKSEPIAEFRTEELQRSNWNLVVEAAEKYYAPGRFTTFVGFEWSAMTYGEANLHRNVIFLGPNYPEKPYTSIDSKHPEDLWRYMDAQRAKGIDNLALPHNPNVSDGLMFDWRDSFGDPISREYAEARMRHEPVVEMVQNKGSSETHPLLSSNDEFADFELYERLLTSGKIGRLDGSYVRQALGRGLIIKSRIGVNPYKFGFAGSSDFHSGVSATEEFNYPGARGASDSLDKAKTMFSATDPEIREPVLSSAAGLTGVWAVKNDRPSIFDALRRKEVFATSGNRIRIRLFAGWDYSNQLTQQPDWVRRAYADGIPMGGDLKTRGSMSAPRFAVHAVKDPDAANLDRIQIIKVWYEQGASHEKVYDVAWSGSRTIDPSSGKLPSVGNTVNTKTATYTNTIGATELATVWIDPDFDRSESAVYYARVLEIPTPRWTTLTAVQQGISPPSFVPPTIQERAWTSPIFYDP